MIEKNNELLELLQNCIKEKEVLRKEQEEIYNKKFKPKNEIIAKKLHEELHYKKDLSTEKFMKEIIKTYFYPTLYKIIEEYGHLLTKEKFDKLKGLLNPENIKFEYNNKKHDISADSEKGVIIIQINKSESLTVERMGNILGTLPHEAFHFIYQFLKSPDEEHARYFYEFSDNKILHFARGKLGTMLAEGIVEKKAMDFCEKNNMFYTINPHYTPYVKLCEYFINILGLTEEDLLTSDYDIILSNLTEDALNDYLYYEGINVLQNFTPKEYENLKEYEIPEIEFDKLKKVTVQDLCIKNKTIAM